VLKTEFSRDNRMLVTAARDGVVQLWDVLSGQRIGQPMRHPGAVRSARFSPDGQHVITACEDRVLRQWSLDAQLRAQTIPGTWPLEDAAFNALGTAILTWADGNAAMVYGLAGGHAQRGHANSTNLESVMTKFNPPPKDEIMVYAAGHADEVTFADVSPDGVLAATASADRTARIWRRATRQPLIDPLLHDAPVNCARFSADSALLVTSTSDQKIRVWDTQTGQPITDWIRTGAPVSSVWLGPNLNFVLTDQGEYWLLYFSREPVPMWLADFADGMAGVHLNERRVMEPVPQNVLPAMRKLFVPDASTNGLSGMARRLVHELPAQSY
jgi:WD40 repeat protein